MAVLLISENTVRELTNIDDNMQAKFLQPSIREAQDIELQSVLGSNLYNKLLELVADDDIDDEENEKYKFLLDTFVKYFLAYMVVANITVIANAKISNAGIVQSDDENMRSISLNDTIKVQDIYKQKAAYYKKRLQDYLISNQSTYPELSEGCSCREISPNLHSADIGCGIFLGGERGKNGQFYEIKGHNKYNKD